MLAGRTYSANGSKRSGSVHDGIQCGPVLLVFDGALAKLVSEPETGSCTNRVQSSSAALEAERTEGASLSKPPEAARHRP